MEYARRIPHPRSGIPAWHWEPKDVRPDEGEYWSSRGVGYDLSGFVKTKAAGERILAMVHEVLGTDKCETYLDYRPSEPTWIQFKFQSSEFDLEKLDKLSREADRVVTKEILKQREVFRRTKSTWDISQIGTLPSMIKVDLGLSNGSVNEDVQIFLTCTSLTYKEILNIYKIIVVDNRMVPTIKLLQEAYSLIVQQDSAII